MSVRKILAEKLLWQTLGSWGKSNAELDRVQFLRNILFFNTLNSWQLKSVSEILLPRNYEKDEMIFEEGQPGAALFLIVRGRVSIEVQHEVATHLAVLEKGAFFGEVALLDESPRSASARAIEPTQTLALFRRDLDNLIKQDPQTACQIYRTLARVIGDRLRSTNDLVQNGDDVISVTTPADRPQPSKWKTAA